MSGEISELPDATTAGILPQVVRVLLDKRRAVKALLKKERNAGKRQELDIRQKAIKLVANSMYGCLGFSNSRFYCEPLASLITSQGRGAYTHCTTTGLFASHPLPCVVDRFAPPVRHSGPHAGADAVARLQRDLR